MKPLLSFTCACRMVLPEHSVESDLPEWALFAGYDTVRWSAESAPAPKYAQMETTPVVDGEYLLHVFKPFCIYDASHTPWVLYRPWNLAEDGWDHDFAHEIPLSAFARIGLTNILSVNEGDAWIKAKVLEILPLPEIVKRFPARPAYPHVEGAQDYLIDAVESRTVARSGDYASVHVAFNDGPVEWAIFQQHESCWRQLCRGENFLHDSYFYVSNLLLNEQDPALYGLT